MADTQRKSNTKRKNDKAAMSDKIIQITQAQLENLIEAMIKKAMRPRQDEINKIKSEFVDTEALIDEITALKAELINASENQNFISYKHNDLVEDCHKLFLINKEQKQNLMKFNRCTAELKKKKKQMTI